MEQCDSLSMTGGRCELPAGHEGEHEKTYESWVARWTAESVTADIARFERRRR